MAVKILSYKEAVRKEVEEELGFPVNDKNFNRFYRYGCKKLEFIIKREGDLHGIRKEPWYLANMIIVNMMVHHINRGKYDKEELYPLQQQ